MFPRRFLVSRGTLDPTSASSLSFTGLSPSLVCISIHLLLDLKLHVVVRTPKCTHLGLGSSAFDRLYLRNRFSFSSSAYLDVSVQQVPFVRLFIHLTIIVVLTIRFPHSDIHGSYRICQSPWLFAAYYVFLRLLVPRHSPYALIT